MKTQLCLKCKKIKSINAFNKDRANNYRDNTARWCRICISTMKKTYKKSPKCYCYQLYKNMKSRCENPKHTCYCDYGGRGIKLNFASANIFAHYIVDVMKVDPRKLQIDRIENNGHYESGNIRFVTSTQNLQNRRENKNCSSKYKGVYWNKRRKKWQVSICVNGKPTYLGRFKNEIDAAEAYDAAALKYFTEFALTNKMLGLFEKD